MDRQTGIALIDSQKWYVDEYGTKFLDVLNEEDRHVQAWLSLRPSYCDRGHIQLNIEGPLNLDRCDSFPRFFFSFKEADEHTRTFLKWRLFKHRTHPHTLD